MATNLIIQGPALPGHLDKLAGLSGAAGMDALSQGAWRFRYAKQREGVAEYCTSENLDFAFVPAGRKLADFGLVAMDMDSTLITIECIDEIADLMGVRDKVAEITASAMRGELDFPESLLARVALPGQGIDVAPAAVTLAARDEGEARGEPAGPDHADPVVTPGHGITPVRTRTSPERQAPQRR